PHGLDNGSVTVVDYEDGKFTVACVGDMSYREVGARVMEEEVEAR
ncbi:MAG: histidine phosphatase family protein, partial [Streptococcus sp.]